MNILASLQTIANYVWIAGFPVSLIRYILSNQAIRRYDKEMYAPLTSAYYEGSDFYNFGYWPAGTTMPTQASENLVERLLAFVPDKKGAVLDVACGKGATTRHLLRYFNASDIVGINLSAKQLERGRANAPGCRFLLMDATKLEFEDNTFDLVICVEAAFHFKTRETFLREAYRVLKPGGYLVLSDALMIWLATLFNSETPIMGYVRNAKAYAALCRRVGFNQVDIVEAREDCWNPYFKHALRWSWKKLIAGEASLLDILSGPMIVGGIPVLLVGDAVITHYLLVSARKD